MSLVSVIVPVYNVEKYLSRCIDSILDQTYTDLELILIDDGSLDSSAHICDEYALRDKRIRVFHKDNGGVSSARNLGIVKAKGDWIMFVDADDWLDIHTIKYVSNYFEKKDLIRFSYKSVFSEDGLQVEDYALKEYDSQKSFLSDAIMQNTYVAIWGGAYKRELFSSIMFDCSLSIGEDWLVFVLLLNQSLNFQIIQEPLYYYNRYNENSCITTASIKKKCNVFFALEQISKSVDNSLYKKELLYIKLILLYNILVPILFCKEKVQMINFVSGNISINWYDIVQSSVDLKKKILISLFLFYKKIRNML